MPVKHAVLPLLLVLLATCHVAMSQTAQLAQGTQQPYSVADYDKLVDAYYDRYFQFHPSQGTAMGLHQYDDLLEDYSPNTRAAEIAFLLDFKQEFGIFHPDLLNEEQRADLKIVANGVNARLLELQQIRMWERNPDVYSSGSTSTIFGLMSRNFAPPEQRLKSVIAREQKIPANLAMAKTNLKNPPKIYTEVALDQMPGIIGFFQADVPAAFKDVKEPSAAQPVQDVERRRHCISAAVSELPERRPASSIEWRFSVGRGEISREAPVRRDGRYPAGSSSANWL